MKISELFYSIQGEGKLVGVPSVFVRVSGCNLRCTWCDTPYASWDPQGHELSIGQIVEAVGRFPARHVVITGGEPMIMPDICELCAALKSIDRHLTLETAATLFAPVEIDLASLSPKLSNSTPHTRAQGRFVTTHERQRINLDVIRKFIAHSGDFQLKFVVSDEKDLQEIDALVESIGGVAARDVLLMPEGTDVNTLRDRSGWLVEVCKRRGYRFCPRLHIELFGHTRGT